MTTEIVIRLIAFLLGIVFIISYFGVLKSIDAGKKREHKIYFRLMVTSMFLLAGLVFSTKVITIGF